MLRMEKMSLTALARQQLAAARTASAGRSAHTVYGGHEHNLRQTLIALVDGCRLHDREHRPTEVLVGNALGVAGASLASLVARRLAHV